MKTFPELFKRSSTGKVQTWAVHVDGNKFYTVEGVVDGKLSTSRPTVCKGKNVGRANETSPEKQAELEAESRWKKKCKKGYTEDIDSIDLVSFQKPMKGDKYFERREEVVFPATAQDKLNGVRSQNDSKRAYSTGGETFRTVPHIRDALAPIYKAYPNAFLDGEFWNYSLRTKLNRLVELVSVVIEPTPEILAESAKIVELHLFDGFGFDGITPETPYLQRHAALKKLIAKFKPKHVFVVECVAVKDEEEFFALMKDNRARKGEGLMLRWGDCPYKNGRSKYLLKCKHWDDSEMEVVDILEGKGNWAGYAKKMILKLPKPSTKGETTFSSNILGDRAYLLKLLKSRKKAIGQMATCRYQGWSEYGVPQLPWVISLRNYE